MISLDSWLASLVFIGLISYITWILSTVKSHKKLIHISEGIMFIVALLILWRVFKLNLDFGLVLSIATLFAGISWSIGYYLKLANLLDESRSYFWILLVILCVRSFGYEPYQIPSSSMEPGLQIGDFVLVNKYEFGLKLPGTYISINKGKKPRKADVAVFYAPHTLCDIKPQYARPDLASLSSRESQLFLSRFLSLQKNRCSKLGTKYVKRVMGVPGDKVVIKGHEIWINEEKLEQNIILEDESQNLYQEAVGNRIHTIRTLVKSGYDEYKWQIPEGKYLALGDNRDNSLDSRAWGYFSEEHLVGKAEFIWLHWGSFTEIPTFSRNGRIN